MGRLHNHQIEKEGDATRHEGVGEAEAEEEGVGRRQDCEGLALCVVQ